jgi:hypothetical protein
MPKEPMMLLWDSFDFQSSMFSGMTFEMIDSVKGCIKFRVFNDNFRKHFAEASSHYLIFRPYVT